MTDFGDEEKDALIRQLWQELQALRADAEKLKRKRVKKTAKNSSLPPAKGFKPNQAVSERAPVVRGGSLGRVGGGRELTPHLDQVVLARAKTCPHCEAELPDSGQQLTGIYERIE